MFSHTGGDMSEEHGKCADSLTHVILFAFVCAVVDSCWISILKT